MDLIRGILLAVEQQPSVHTYHPLELPGRSKAEVQFHLLLLREAALRVPPSDLQAQPIADDRDRVEWFGGFRVAPR